MRNYLRLRLRILGRQVAELGWLRLVVLGPILLVVMWQVLRLPGKMPAGAWLLVGLSLSLCWSMHRQRPDLAFLQGAAPDFRRWLLVEYALLQLPICGALLAHGAWWAAGLALALLPLITHLSSREVVSPSRERASIWRSEAFEWVSGYRKAGAWLVWSIGLGIAVWQRHSTVAALVPLLWTLVLSSFYFTAEDPVMLLQYPRRAGVFLRRKIRVALSFYLLTSLPFIVSLGTGAVTWGGALGIFLWGAMVLTMVILAKYAFYPHAEPVQAGVIGLALLVVINSVYVALLTAACTGLIWKSRRQLLQYRWND